jgi:hypothetical protein
MTSFARAFMSVMLLAAAGLGAGCSSSGGGLLAGSTPAVADASVTGAPGRPGEERFSSEKFYKEQARNGSP